MWTRTTAHRLLAADDRNREIGAVNLTAAESAKRSLRLFVDEADSGEPAVDGGHQSAVMSEVAEVEDHRA